MQPDVQEQQSTERSRKFTLYLRPEESDAQMPIGKALLKAGYSKQQSLKGMAAVPARVLKMLPKKAQRLMNLGKMTTPEEMRALVHGRLIDNVTKAKDGGAQSAKILGTSAGSEHVHSRTTNGHGRSSCSPGCPRPQSGTLSKLRRG